MFSFQKPIIIILLLVLFLSILVSNLGTEGFIQKITIYIRDIQNAHLDGSLYTRHKDIFTSDHVNNSVIQNGIKGGILELQIPHLIQLQKYYSQISNPQLIIDKRELDSLIQNNKNIRFDKEFSTNDFFSLWRDKTKKNGNDDNYNIFMRILLGSNTDLVAGIYK